MHIWAASFSFNGVWLNHLKVHTAIYYTTPAWQLTKNGLDGLDWIADTDQKCLFGPNTIEINSDIPKDVYTYLYIIQDVIANVIAFKLS